MISVPEACLLPRMPGRSASRDQRVDRGRAGSRAGCAGNSPSRTAPARRRSPSGRTACPCRADFSAAQPQAPSTLRRSSPAAMPSAVAAARPRPERAQVRQRAAARAQPGSIARGPAAQAAAIWPSVSAPASPKRAASGAPPMPKESRTRMNGAASMQPICAIRCARAWRDGGAASPSAIGCRSAASAALRAPLRRAHGRWRAGGPVRPRRRGRARSVRPTAWSILSSGAAPAAAELDRRRGRARACRSPATKPALRRQARSHDRRARQDARSGARRSRRARRAPPPCARSARPPAPRCQRLLASRRRARAMSAREPPSTSISAAERQRHLVQPRVALLAGAGSRRLRAPRARCRRRVPSGWFMSVMSARGRAGRRRWRPRRCSRRARAASSASAMKAPEPVFTSSTRPSSPAASFFDRIEAVISGIDSTVAVTSRMA